MLPGRPGSGPSPPRQPALWPSVTPPLCRAGGEAAQPPVVPRHGRDSCAWEPAPRPCPGAGVTLMAGLQGAAPHQGAGWAPPVECGGCRPSGAPGRVTSPAQHRQQTPLSFPLNRQSLRVLGERRDRREGGKCPLFPGSLQGASGGGRRPPSRLPLTTCWHSPGPWCSSGLSRHGRGGRSGLVVTGVRETQRVKYHLRSWYSGTSVEYEKKIFISFFACESDALFKESTPLQTGAELLPLKEVERRPREVFLVILPPFF